jgi:hypothetical protein
MADKKKVMRLLMQGDGKMEWDFPEGGNLPRAQAYEVLGMIEYARSVLIKMLQQPQEQDAS